MLATSKLKPGARITLVHIMTVPFSLIFLRGQAQYLSRQGFDVHLITSPGDELTAFAEHEHVIGHGLKMTREISPLRDLWSLVRLTLLLHTLRPQVVHAGTPKAGLLGMLAAWFLRVPVRVYHVHGLRYQTTSGFKRTLLRWAEKLSCLLAHRVYCVSPSLRRVLIGERLCSSSKVHVVGQGSANGIDAEHQFNSVLLPFDSRDVIRNRYGIPVDAFLVGYVGRVVRDKGLTELAEAWQSLRASSDTFHLLLVGPFEPHDPLPSNVETLLRSDTRIHLVGFQSNIAPFYAALDLLVLPSYREGLPDVLLEAAAMKLPVVATRIPGCVDAVQDGLTGTLVPPHDSSALEAAIRRYAADPSLRRRHGEAGRERVLSDFRSESIWDALFRADLRLLSNKGIEVSPPFSLTTRTRLLPGSGFSLARALKRLLDLGLSLTGLILLGPLLGIVALAILVTMGRPVLFRQLRPGQRANPFILYKFRSMREQPGLAVHLLSDEERLTPLGRFLRKTSIDELPQLWNVLRGDMSLVGPRPKMMEDLSQYSPEEMRRLSVPPGITGWAQIHGRNAIDLKEIYQLDTWYIDHWSLWLDFKILLLTPFTVLRAEGLSGKGQSPVTLRASKAIDELGTAVPQNENVSPYIDKKATHELG